MPAAKRPAGPHWHAAVTLSTPKGPARLFVAEPPAAGGDRPRLLVLGHGAGGSVDAADLLAVQQAGRDLGWAVVAVEQPYRVAGRRAPPAASTLDIAWVAAVRAVLAGRAPGLLRAAAAQAGREPLLVLGGRSSGARVACRTAAGLQARAVLCLAFPWHPPGKPERTRTDEVAAVDVPVLLVQGDRDPFGQPPATLMSRPGVSVTVVEGDDHGLSRHPDQVRSAAVTWLRRVAADG